MDLPSEEDRVARLQFDQSHFLKAFKQFAGMTPRVYSGIRDYGLVYIPD